MKYIVIGDISAEVGTKLERTKPQRGVASIMELLRRSARSR
jgi:hypothetical protein